jgi:hypothetical protein
MGRPPFITVFQGTRPLNADANGDWAGVLLVIVGDFGAAAWKPAVLTGCGRAGGRRTGKVGFGGAGGCGMLFPGLGVPSDTKIRTFHQTWNKARRVRIAYGTTTYIF